MTSDIDSKKKAMRAVCAARRDALAEAARAAGSQAIAEIGLGFAGAARGALVSAFMAMGSEIDPLALLIRVHAEGHPTCLPVVTPLGQPLVFRAWVPGEPLVPRKWGIREPSDMAPQVDPDVLIVPLLAFDGAGYRLGYGGGYFDRTLKRLRGIKPIIAIGVAFDAQEMEAVPRGPYDEPLDWVLTPSRARQFTDH